MSIRTGIAVLLFLALVLVIQFPTIADAVRDLPRTEPSVPAPAPLIAAPGIPGLPVPGTVLPSTIVVESDLTSDELKLLALDLINEDRRLHDLPPVELGTNSSAQMHADDMLRGKYLGHWWLDGNKPYMVYSREGGDSYVSENAARTGFSFSEFAELCTDPDVVCERVVPVEDVKRLHTAMVYDDADSEWRHRENLLNPDHRKVNIGIAYSSHFLAFVQHFEGGDASAPRPPWFNGTMLNIRADLNRPDFNVFPTVHVHFEESPSPKSAEDIERLKTYCVGGGFSESCGEPLVQIVPPPSPGTRYLNLPDRVIVASSWVVSGGDIEIVADLGRFAGKEGVYTTTIFRDGGDGVSAGIAVQLSSLR